MKNLILCTILVLLVLPASGQTPKLKMVEFSASSGILLSSTGRAGRIQDYHINARGSRLLKNDFSGFNEGYNNGYQGFSSTTIALGFNLRNMEQTGYHANRIFRLGFTFGNSSSFVNSFHNHESFPIDTITSSNGGKYAVDSVSSQHLFMNVEAMNILVDAALIFNTTSSPRWKFFAGVGVQAGMNFNGVAHLSYFQSSYQSSQLGSFNGTTSENSTQRINERANVRQGLAGGIYIPMGLDWQTGAERPFFKQLHLFYEVRPTLSIIRNRDFGAEVKTALNQQIGIRVKFTN